MPRAKLKRTQASQNTIDQAKAAKKRKTRSKTKPKSKSTNDYDHGREVMEKGIHDIMNELRSVKGGRLANAVLPEWSDYLAEQYITNFSPEDMRAYLESVITTVKQHDSYGTYTDDHPAFTEARESMEKLIKSSYLSKPLEKPGVVSGADGEKPSTTTFESAYLSEKPSIDIDNKAKAVLEKEHKETLFKNEQDARMEYSKTRGEMISNINNSFLAGGKVPLFDDKFTLNNFLKSRGGESGKLNSEYFEQFLKSSGYMDGDSDMITSDLTTIRTDSKLRSYLVGDLEPDYINADKNSGVNKVAFTDARLNLLTRIIEQRASMMNTADYTEFSRSIADSGDALAQQALGNFNKTAEGREAIAKVDDRQAGLARDTALQQEIEKEAKYNPDVTEVAHGVDGDVVMGADAEPVYTATKTIRPTKIALAGSDLVKSTQGETIQDDILFDTFSWVPDGYGLGPYNSLHLRNKQHDLLRFGMEPMYQPRTQEEQNTCHPQPIEWENSLPKSVLQNSFVEMLEKQEIEGRGAEVIGMVGSQIIPENVNERGSSKDLPPASIRSEFRSIYDIKRGALERRAFQPAGTEYVPPPRLINSSYTMDR